MKFENIYYNREPSGSGFGSKETKDLDNLPKSSLEMLNTFSDKLEDIKKLFPAGGHIVYSHEFIKDLSRFIDSIKEYGENVDNYNKLLDRINEDRDLMKPESQEKNMEVELFKQKELQRVIIHDSAIKNFVRLIDSYNEMFTNLSSHPLIDEKQKEKLGKEKFPWKINIFLDKDGEIKKKFVNEKKGIDLSYLSKEERDVLSEWMLKLGRELQEVQNYDEQIQKQQENKEINLDENSQQMIDLNFALHQLEEEKKAAEKYEQYKSKKT